MGSYGLKWPGVGGPAKVCYAVFSCSVSFWSQSKRNHMGKASDLQGRMCFFLKEIVNWEGVGTVDLFIEYLLCQVVLQAKGKELQIKHKIPAL